MYNYQMPYPYTVGQIKLSDIQTLQTFLWVNWSRLMILSAAAFAALNPIFAFVLSKIRKDRISAQEYFKITGIGAVKGAIFYFIVALLITALMKVQITKT